VSADCLSRREVSYLRFSSHIRSSDLSVGDDLVDSGSDLVGVVIEAISGYW